MDETCLSTGDVFAILTNRAAKGRKGALVAMVRGVATDAVDVYKRQPVDGEEIMRVFDMKPCREIGSLKSAIKDAILDGVIPNEHDEMCIRDSFIPFLM